MNPKELKQKITDAVLAELTPPNTPDGTPEKIMERWFVNPNQEGLRLTYLGNEGFIAANIEFFDFELEHSAADPQGWYGILLDMSKKIKCPYYLGTAKTKRSGPYQPSKLGKGKPYIRVYDSKIAMMVGLYGNLKDYLESVKIKTRKY